MNSSASLCKLKHLLVSLLSCWLFLCYLVGYFTVILLVVSLSSCWQSYCYLVVVSLLFCCLFHFYLVDCLTFIFLVVSLLSSFHCFTVILLVVLLLSFLIVSLLSCWKFNCCVFSLFHCYFVGVLVQRNFIRARNRHTKRRFTWQWAAVPEIPFVLDVVSCRHYHHTHSLSATYIMRR